MTKGEKIRIKDLDFVLLSVWHRSDRCLLAGEESHVISSNFILVVLRTFV
jgi:hypothetical protein